MEPVFQSLYQLSYPGSGRIPFPSRTRIPNHHVRDSPSRSNNELKIFVRLTLGKGVLIRILSRLMWLLPLHPEAITGGSRPSRDGWRRSCYLSDHQNELYSRIRLCRLAPLYSVIASANRTSSSDPGVLYWSDPPSW